jgi:hypothetical protein
MNRKVLLAVVFATALSGCATYDYTSGSAPGGYYHGRPTTEYYGPYGGGYGYPGGGTSIYIGSGYGGYGYPGYGYSRYPYYGHYNPYYPHYRPPYRPSRPHNPDHGHQPPRPPSGSGKRPPPWRDPTSGAWRESGQVMIPPRHENRVVPAPGAPRVRSDVPRQMPTAPRQAPSSRVERVERSQPAVERRPAPRSHPRGIRTQEP